MKIPADAEAKDYALSAAFSFSWNKLPKITKPFVLSVISADMLGNLMPNGDFETADAGGRGPEGWQVTERTKSWGSSEGQGLGLGKRLLKFTDTKNQWEHCGRTIELRGGHTYLYTAWVRNRDMGGGSNIRQHLTTGQTRPLFTTQVFSCGETNAHWQVFTCRYRAPENLKSAGFNPVVKGSGWALFDNIRVTLFEGTDFAAEGHRTPRPPVIDGKLGDWVRKCPVPLIGKNQLGVRREPYTWTPENLSAVAYLMWDDRNLYVALDVLDDRHHAGTTGDKTTEGDSLVLAFDPTNRGPASAARAFAYYISSAGPGGGSGRHTIYRPGERSAGLKSGQLVKDSSVYDMAAGELRRGDAGGVGNGQRPPRRHGDTESHGERRGCWGTASRPCIGWNGTSVVMQKTKATCHPFSKPFSVSPWWSFGPWWSFAAEARVGGGA